MRATELVAGPELDALIAERVMGWRRMTYFEQYGPAHHDTPYYRSTQTPYWHDATGKEQGGCSAEPLYLGIEAWSPSADIAAAWAIVEHMDYMWKFNLSSLWPEWQAIFFNAGVEHKGSGETAPLAICRAALVAHAH